MAEVIETYADSDLNGGDPSVNVPSIQSGDRLVVIATDVYVSGVGTVTHSGGSSIAASEIGSALGAGDGESNTSMRAWLYVASANIGSLTITQPATYESTLTVVHCRGVGDVAAVADRIVPRNGSPAADQTLGPITAPSGGGLIIGAWAGVQFSGSLAWSTPAGMAEEAATNVADVHACMVASEVTSSSGAISRSSTGSPAPDSGFAGKLIILANGDSTPPPARENINVDHVGSGAWVAGAAGITPAYPAGTLEGDLLYLVTATKTSNTVGNGQIPDPVPPAGWTLLLSWWTSGLNQGHAEGTGRIRMCVFWRFAPASPSGTISVSQLSGTGFVTIGHIRGYRAEAGRTNTEYSHLLSPGERNTTGTSWSAALAAMDLTLNDRVALILCSNDDTAFTAASVSQTGTTFAALAASPATQIATTTGYDLSGAGYETRVSAGGATGSVSYSATLAAAEAGLIAILRVRATAEVPTGPEPGRMLLAA